RYGPPSHPHGPRSAAGQNRLRLTKIADLKHSLRGEPLPSSPPSYTAGLSCDLSSGSDQMRASDTKRIKNAQHQNDSPYQRQIL
ncbi:hypothetical protein, partial [Nonomuraea sp. NPDC005730]|uniref:hypothetical protein n=1 Tax=Nonomuraea sp. NPDC005730 TaxID=3157055 RepID=UPI0033FAA8F6